MTDTKKKSSKAKVETKKKSDTERKKETKAVSKKVVKKAKSKSVARVATQVKETESPKAEVAQKKEQKTLLLYCPRCKRETDNTITQFIGQKIRRVRCEVCKSEHNYHRLQALKKKMEEEAAGKVEEKKESSDKQNYYRMWEELMLGRDPQTARQYNIKDKYFENDMINHPVFGIGIVKTVMEDYKIEVVFKNCIKILIHNRFLPRK
jgi:Fe2+ transport system protein B